LKNNLREIYKEKRKKISKSEIDNLSINIANKTLDISIWNYTNFHIFLTLEKFNEVNTNFILSILQGRDKNIYVPKVISNSKIQSILLQDNTILKLNKFGVPEPESGLSINSKLIDVIFIPLLAYDIKGNRVGYGKGFYDRFLSKCKNDLLKIGLSFFPPENQIIKTNSHDVPIDICVTPNKIFKF
tara:strand:- start:2627 stop:3184 length:558 start_codon:yes stop_codon:yes gene_type:complete